MTPLEAGSTESSLTSVFIDLPNYFFYSEEEEEEKKVFFSSSSSSPLHSREECETCLSVMPRQREISLEKAGRLSNICGLLQLGTRRRDCYIGWLQQIKVPMSKTKTPDVALVGFN